MPTEADNFLVQGRSICLTRQGKSILQAVDLDILPQQIVTLIGLNGAGKTTLVKIILGLIQPDSGAIRRKPGLTIGYSPQNIDRDPVMPLTVQGFMQLGSPTNKSRIDEVLDEVGASGLGRQQVMDLSGGEFHRIMLARALLREPDLLVLDEPLAGVDVTGQSDLYRLIGEIRDRHHLGVLMVSHDLHLVMAATDHVICLNQHVCCTGHPETVANHPEFMNLFGDGLASNLGVYVHHHDHTHAVDGSVVEEHHHDG